MNTTRSYEEWKHSLHDKPELLEWIHGLPTMRIAALKACPTPADLPQQPVLLYEDDIAGPHGIYLPESFNQKFQQTLSDHNVKPHLYEIMSYRFHHLRSETGGNLWYNVIAMGLSEYVMMTVKDTPERVVISSGHEISGGTPPLSLASWGK